MEEKEARAVRKERARAKARTKEKVKVKPKVMVLNKINSGAVLKGNREVHRRSRASTEPDASSCAAGWQGKAPLVAHLLTRTMKYSKQRTR